MKKFSIFIAIFFVSFPSFGKKVLATPAYTFDSASVDTLNNPPFTLGWSFLVDNSFYVNNLGIYDFQLDGLIDSYQVGIFDDSGTLMVSTLVNTSDPLINQFRYSSIPNTLLTAGEIYSIGALYLTSNDPLILPNVPVANFQTDSRLSYLTNVYASGVTLTAPTENYPGTSYYGYFGPNLTITPVPEPSTFLLLGGGLVGLAFVARRRKKE